MSRRVFRDQRAGESLDSFSQRCVETPDAELRKLNREVDEFVTFLQQEFVGRAMSVSKVVKAGSLGKGTAVRDSADIDLVVFFNGLSYIDDLYDNRKNLMDQINRGVDRYGTWKGRIRLTNRTPFSLQYTLDGHEVDLLPAFARDHQNDTRNRDLMYKHMEDVARQKGPGNKGQGFVAQQFSASLAPLQVAFVKREPESVKKVIRLLKKWKQENKTPKENGLDGLRSYTLELITIHTATAAGRHISTDDLFFRCLRVLADRGSMSVYFEENYRVNGVPHPLWSHSSPYVMDVANPYMNTLHGTKTQRVSRKAQEALRQLQH